MTHYVRLVFLGDYANARRAIREIRGNITGLITQMRNVAAIAPVMGAALIAAVPLAFGALAVKLMLDTEKVGGAFDKMVAEITGGMQELAQGPYEDMLLRKFEQIEATFHRISPILLEIFQRTAPMVDRLSTAVLNFVERAMPGFLAIVRVADPVIQALSVGIEKLGFGFRDMLINISAGAPGATIALTSFFNLVSQLLPKIGQLIAILTNGFAPIIGAITPAVLHLADGVLLMATRITEAAGPIGVILSAWITNWGNLLPIIGQVIAALATGLAPIFQALVPLIQLVAQTIANLLTPLLVGLGPIIARLVEALRIGLEPAFKALERAFQMLTPILLQVVDAIGRLLAGAIQVLAPLLPPIIDALGQVVAVLLRFIPPVIEIAMRLLPAFSQILGAVVQGVLSLLPPILQLAEQLFPVLVDVLSTVVDMLVTHLAPILVETANQLFPALVEVLNALVPVIVDLAKAVLPALLDIFRQVIPVIAELARVVLPLLADVIRDIVVPIIKDVLAPVIKVLAENVIPVLVKILEALVALLRNVVVPAIRWLADIFKEYVLPFLRDTVIPFLGNTLAGALRVVADLLNKMVEGLKVGFNAVVEFFKGLPEKIMSFLVDMPRRLYESGANMIQSFADGMNSRVEAAREAGHVAVDAASNPFPSSPAKTGPLSGQGYTLFRGQRMIEDFAQGMRNAAPNLASIAQSVISGASSAISGFLGAGGTARASIQGVGAIEVRVAPGADSALASLLMNMVRTGQLQLVRAG